MMPSVERDVLALINFQNTNNPADTVCIFSRAFAKNRPCQKDVEECDLNLSSGTEEEEVSSRPLVQTYLTVSGLVYILGR